MNMGLFGVFF